MASHMTLDKSVFDPASISEETHVFNQKLMDIMSKGPKWYEVGAPKYREMRAKGETPLPAFTLLDSATTFEIPSRDNNRTIPCRILCPQTKNNDNNTPKGVFMHIHGGGWVLQSESAQDVVLQEIANSTNTLAISIGYRLAPEHPFPAASNDCYDAAEWLVSNSTSEFNAPLTLIGGESAGGHLAMLTCLHLLQHVDPKYHDFQLKGGLLLHFGCYDLNFTPSVDIFQLPEILVLDRDLMVHYIEVFCPGMTFQQKKDPNVSPLYADLEKLRGRLPAALFTCGTMDPLLDDTVFMSSKWLMAGAEAVVRILPGAPHGYIGYPRSVKGSLSSEGLDAVAEFVRGRLG